MSASYSCGAVAGLSGPSVGARLRPRLCRCPTLPCPPVPRYRELVPGKLSSGLPHTCQRRRGGDGLYKQRHFYMLINLRHHLA